MRAPTYIYQSRDIDDEVEDFAEYLWMADMESFDKQVLDQLIEEEEMENCMEEMLAEEEERETVYFVYALEGTDDVCVPVLLEACSEDTDFSTSFSTLSLQVPEDILRKSNLNPYAEEFIPSVYLSDEDDSSDGNER